jgi:hypothetical protein
VALLARECGGAVRPILEAIAIAHDGDERRRERRAAARAAVDETMIQLPIRERRRNETTILRASLVAINRIPGVRATRNNVGKSPVACAYCTKHLCKRCRPRLTYPITFGLGVGSPDVIGIYSLPIVGGVVLPLAFALEFKKPGARTERKHADDQAAWMRVARSRGIQCETVRSVDESTSAVLAMISTWRASLSAIVSPSSSDS